MLWHVSGSKTETSSACDSKQLCLECSPPSFKLCMSEMMRGSCQLIISKFRKTRAQTNTREGGVIVNDVGSKLKSSLVVPVAARDERQI